MSLTINLVPLWVTYHDNEFRCLLDQSDPDHWHLPVFTLDPTDPPSQLTSYLMDQLPVTLPAELTVAAAQATVLTVPPTLPFQTLTLPVLIQLNMDQYGWLTEQPDPWPMGWHWEPWELRPLALDPVSGQLLTQARQYLIDQFRLHRLTGVRYLLPPTFSGKTVIAELTTLCGHPLVYNNLRRDYHDQLIFLAKDHHKRGRPTRLWRYGVANQSDLVNYPNRPLPTPQQAGESS